MGSLLNIVNQLLSYSDFTGYTDNPQMRAFDWTRRLSSIPVERPSNDTVSIPPGGTATIFSGVRPTPLDATSVLSLSLLPTTTSNYVIQVTAGTSGFRTPRTISSLTACAVTVNNASVATFTFTGATLTGVVVGDTMRISGQLLNDAGPFAFNALNSGLWTVIAVTTNSVQAIRPTGTVFSGQAEVVATVTSNDVQIYSAAGIQPGDKFEVKGAFSVATRRVYEVFDATPTTIQFISTMPIPTESGVAYPDPIISGHSIVFYYNAKRLVYIETDQDISVRFNSNTDDTVKVKPISPGDPANVGFMSKWGDTYQCVVVNQSVNIAEVKFFIAE